MNSDSTSNNQPLRPEEAPPSRLPLNDRIERARKSRERATDAIESQALSNREVLEQLAARALEVPPGADHLTFGAAAARYALTNLEAARLLAEQIRAEVELGQEEKINAATGRLRPDEAIGALLG